jgi:membrane protein implicated in regulation of membrane protease activity
VCKGSAAVSLIGLTGTVTMRVPGGSAPGEISLTVRGRTDLHIAYSAEPIEVGTQVLVIDVRGPLNVMVEPWPADAVFAPQNVSDQRREA